MTGADRTRRATITVAMLLGAGLVGGSPATAMTSALAAPPGSTVASPSTDPPRAAPAVSTDWVWPVPPPRAVLNRYRAPAHDYGPGHRGADLAAAVGVAVVAPADGVIAFRGTVADRPLITIDTGDGRVITLEPVDSDRSAGDAVGAGEVIGTSAIGGHAEPGSVHIGLRIDGVYVDPMTAFGPVPRAVLLPCCAAL